MTLAAPGSRATGRQAGAGQLLLHREIWDRKASLRRVYREQFFSALQAGCARGGPTVEIGSGPGFLREYLPEAIATDILPMPWMDLAMDAARLPLRNGAILNLVGIDVLHHLASPIGLLREAERCLRPGGRLVLIEPWISPLSYILYRWFHQEDCDLGADPFRMEEAPSKAPFDGNQALPYLLFRARGIERLRSLTPGLSVLRIRPFSLFTYLLSLGFKKADLLPERLYPAVYGMERITEPLWRRWAALRVLIVVERR